MNPLRSAARAVVAPTVLVLAACGGGQDRAATAEAAEPVTVTIQTFDFQPDPPTVPAGSVVRFVNDDAIDHTVTAGTREAPAPEEFDGVLPGRGATFEVDLAEPGTYAYFCRIHDGPGMTAVLTVE